MPTRFRAFLSYSHADADVGALAAAAPGDLSGAVAAGRARAARTARSGRAWAPSSATATSCPARATWAPPSTQRSGRFRCADRGVFAGRRAVALGQRRGRGVPRRRPRRSRAVLRRRRRTGQRRSGTRSAFPRRAGARLPTARVVEPLAADARREGDGRERAFLKLVAGLLGIGYDALARREAQRRQPQLADRRGGLARRHGDRTRRSRRPPTSRATTRSVARRRPRTSSASCSATCARS